MQRRTLLSRLAFLPALAGLAAGARAAEPSKPLKIMFKSAWGIGGVGRPDNHGVTPACS